MPNQPTAPNAVTIPGNIIYASGKAFSTRVAYTFNTFGNVQVSTIVPKTILFKSYFEDLIISVKNVGGPADLILSVYRIFPTPVTLSTTQGSSRVVKLINQKIDIVNSANFKEYHYPYLRRDITDFFRTFNANDLIYISVDQVGGQAFDLSVTAIFDRK